MGWEGGKKERKKGGRPKPQFPERRADGRRPLKKTDGADRQTNRQTDGHRNLETESAQWADSVKIWQFYNG